MKKLDLRKEAKGRHCTLMLHSDEPHNHDPDTVSLHHIRNRRIFRIGTGQKPPDIFGCWACHICHTIVHNPPDDWDADMLELDELRAMVETQFALHKEGKL